MIRCHLFEFEDQGWFPRLLRDAGTSYLQFVSRRFRIHEAIAPVLYDALLRCGTSTIVDLCSGGGGPVIDVVRLLRESDSRLKVVLTDKFPNLVAFERAKSENPEFVRFEADPIGATQVPKGLTGMRTLFNAFHHFEPKTAAQILADAVQSGNGILIFEAGERRPRNIISFVPIFILVLLVMPFLRPTRLSWLFCTYLVPIIPLVIAWDGVASHLRTYTDDELLTMTRELPGNEWQVVKVSIAKSKMIATALVGLPERCVHTSAPDSSSKRPASRGKGTL